MCPLPSNCKCLRQPRVSQRLLSRKTIAGAPCQQLPDQVQPFLRDVHPVHSIEGGAVTATDLAARLLISLATKGEVAAEECVRDDAAAPQVTCLVVLPANHLRCHEGNSAHALPEHLARHEGAGKAKVSDPQVVAPQKCVRGEEQAILRLEVAVAHVAHVKVEDRAEDLLHDVCSLLLRETAGLDDASEELAPDAQLHDEVEAPRVLVALEKPHNVGVVQQPHDLDLLPELRHVLHLLLRHHLDRPGRATHVLVRAPAHAAEGALAELALQLVMLVDAPRSVRDEVRAVKARALAGGTARAIAPVFHPAAARCRNAGPGWRAPLPCCLASSCAAAGSHLTWNARGNRQERGVDQKHADSGLRA
mmetsp:Transcript_52954/g.146750  ORF Transcript_52954/g.146750 Transcript_52954/m.146750 type:complete len:363 (-) Transcript_52954:2-1090(-)